MVNDGPVRPITVDQDSMKRSSSGDEEMVGVHDLEPTKAEATKCQTGRPHAKVVKMNCSGPLRHHRVRNHRFLDYLVGSVSCYPFAIAHGVNSC